MPIHNKQLEDKPRKMSASTSAPVVDTGEGAWYIKIVSGVAEGFYKDDQGNEIQITSNGVINVSGAVSSVNGLTGAVVLNADNINDSGTTKKFTTSANLTKLSGIQAGAEVNPVQVSTPERTAGTELGLRSYAPEDIRQMILTHSGGGGAVSSVNGKTGVVIINPDDLNDTSTTNKFITAANLSKLSGIQSGAEVNPTQVSSPEITAGTEAALRSFSPANIKSMIDTHASGGSGTPEVYTIVLPDAANLAARLLLATTPANWTLTSADADAETQFGADTESLVIIWDSGLGTKIANVTVYDNNTSTSAVGGIKVIATSQSNPSNIKVNSSLTKAVVQFTSLGGLPSGRDVYIQVALS